MGRLVASRAFPEQACSISRDLHNCEHDVTSYCFLNERYNESTVSYEDTGPCGGSLTSEVGIGSCDLVHWLEGSPDLSCITFISGYLKSMVHATLVISVKDPIVRICVAAGRIRDMSGIFQNVRNSMEHHCQDCQTRFGRNIELRF
ncbi:hypothetical protein TNCV_2867151 [Trichonephila clavipes]|nr:hypothetical protein TNCV_2867151 [Trichonephila clavipes]